MSDCPDKPRRFVIGEGTHITIGLGVLLLGLAFWMGVMHMQLQGLNAGLDKVLSDHEARIRALERK